MFNFTDSKNFKKFKQICAKYEKLWDVKVQWKCAKLKQAKQQKERKNVKHETTNIQDFYNDSMQPQHLCLFSKHPLGIHYNLSNITARLFSNL